MTIPRWLANKRHETCARCEIVKSCEDKITLLSQTPRCSLRRLHSLADEMRWAAAWPESAERASGCCDPVANGWGASH